MPNIKITPTNWTRADALKIKFDDPTTTQPEFDYDFPVMDDKRFIWDTMPLRKLDGTIVSVNGWSVIFTLTATRQPDKYQFEDGRYDIVSDWEHRHDRARICYWYSRDGENWEYGGRVMREGISPTSREWAGTPILLNKNGEIDLYYTCVNPNATIAKVRGQVVTSDAGVLLQGFEKVIPLFTADGFYYQTESQNQYWNFRDPSPFVDPKDGKLYMVFEGNIAGKRGSHKISNAEKGILPPGHDEMGGLDIKPAVLVLRLQMMEMATVGLCYPPLYLLSVLMIRQSGRILFLKMINTICLL